MSIACHTRIWAWFAAVFVIAAAAIELPAAEKPPIQPLRALFICGGCCHDYDAQKELISQGLRDRAHMEVTVVHQGGSATDSRIPIYEDPNWSPGYDVVLHDECFAGVKDPAWTERILRSHRAGLPGVVIHCAMHCYRDGTDEWFKFCGVTSHNHGKAYPHEVLNRDGAHPIMAAFGPGWFNPAGELYLVKKLWPTAHALAASKSQENGQDHVCVWTNQYGAGRVFGTTLGHHNETVKHPVYLDLLARGTLWACGKLNDDYLKPARPQLIAVNLARDKATTASSEESNKHNLAGNAIDGDPKTRWCAANPQSGNWLQVDLGQGEDLTGCQLDWESDNALYRYRVEGSTDGQAWKTLVDASQQGASGGKPLAFTAAGQRYVRVTYLGSNTGAWASLREVHVFGTKHVTLEPKSHAQELERELLAEVEVPDGFTANVYAAPPAVNYPVFVAAAPNGDLYVSSDKNGSLGREPNRGSVLRLRDTDHDGRADEVTRLVANVDSPRGLVWDHDRLYLMHPPHLSAYIDQDGDGIAEEEFTLVKNIAFTFKDRPADHTSNGVTLGIDGWLYLAIGDFGFMEAEGTDGRKVQMRGGGVVRVRPDGTNLEIHSRGTRNILEVGVDPLLNGFTRDNTNDGGGWDIRLHHFSGLEHHGYPSLFKNFGDEIVQPLADYGGGSGCGTLYLDEPGFPAGYGNAMYTADWGRSIVYRHRLEPKGATFAADQSEFVKLPRVTDLDVDAMSRLYVTSWKGATFNYTDENVGYVVRVIPNGFRPEPLPNFEKATEKELVAMLDSPSHRRRLEAQRELVRRGAPGADVVQALQAVAAEGNKLLASRVAAVFAIKQCLGAKAAPVLTELASSDSIREYALRALTDRTDELKGVPVEPILIGLKDRNPRVRNAAAISAARLGKPEPISALTELLIDRDPLVVHTAINALVKLRASAACLAILDEPGVPGQRREGALRVLQALHEAAVVDGLATRLAKENDAQRRRGLLSALCRLHFREGPWTGNSWGTRPDTSGPYYQTEEWEATPRIAAVLKEALRSARGDEAVYLADQISLHKIATDEVLATMLTLAEQDRSVLASAVMQLARAPNVPARAIPLLIDAATADDTADSVRALSAWSLTKTDDERSWPAILAALARLQGKRGAEREFNQARDGFLNSPHLSNHHRLMEEEAARLAGGPSIWADGALLSLAASKSGSPEVHELAVRALDAGWRQPARRAQILKAVAAIAHSPSRERVLEALKDSDPAVVGAARQAAAALRIDPNAKPSKPTGPVIAKLKTDDIVAAVLKTPGDARLGEDLFVRLNCVKCHTTKPDEPLRGPFLGNIASTYKRRELAEAVLIPSKSIAQGFVTNVFVLDDGRLVTGFVTQEAADQVTIRDIEGKELRIPTAQIEERAKQPISMMPEGLVKEITLHDFASLVSFLESLVKK